MRRTLKFRCPTFNTGFEVHALIDSGFLFSAIKKYRKYSNVKYESILKIYCKSVKKIQER